MEVGTVTCPGHPQGRCNHSRQAKHLPYYQLWQLSALRGGLTSDDEAYHELLPLNEVDVHNDDMPNAGHKE